MPWKKTEVEKVRENFVLKALEPHANVAELCREYSVSRKTGYKWIERFTARGLAGLADLSRRPRASPVQVTGEAVLHVLEQRRAHARWGPRKLRRVLLRQLAPAEFPSERTIARILDRAGEIRSPKRRPRTAPTSPPDEIPVEPNDLWTLDFKGYWTTTGGEKCEPLTVRDAYSRFVLQARLMKSRSGDSVRREF